MGALSHFFTFPLGGVGGGAGIGGKPFIVNMHPAPEEVNTKLLQPISFSLRDVETYIDSSTINIVTGYSKIYGRGKNFFDQEVPGTVRHGFTQPLTNNEPFVTLIPNPSPDEAVRIKKRIDGIERSVYFTKVEVDDDNAFRNVMISGLIKPVTLTNENGSQPLGYTGALLGLELGPRNTAVYVFLKTVDGAKKIFLAGPFIPAHAAVPGLAVDYDWSVNQRYTLIWNESRGRVQLFANNDQLIVNELITNFPQFAEDSPRHVTPTQYAVAYGVEGKTNEEVEISAISFTDDVGYPLIRAIKPSAFTSIVKPADLVKTTPGVDPRRDFISPWYEDSIHFGAPDVNGSFRTTSQFFQIARVTPSPACSKVIYREEPCFIRGIGSGYTVDINFFGTCTQFDGDATGMGFAIMDSFSAFRIGCFQKDGTRYIGILKSGGSETALVDQFFVEYDWSVPGILRFVVDGKQNVVRFYNHDDLAIPLLDVPLVRSDFPVPFDFTWDNFIPFLALGHYANTQTTGSLYLRGLTYSHLYENWEANDTLLPDSMALMDPWTRNTTGSPFISSQPLVNGYVLIDCGSGDLANYTRSADTNEIRGGSLEFRVSISDNEKAERTGDSVIYDDGVHAFIISFVDSEEGRFICFSVRDGLGSYTEVVGFDGDSKFLSSRLDWTQPHTYRFERKPNEGAFLFVDEDPKPRLFITDAQIQQFLPSTIYLSATIAFGHFQVASPSIAKWYFVRAFWSSGYEITYKLTKPDAVLKDKLFANEAIVLVEATDADPEPTPPPPPPPCTGGYPWTQFLPSSVNNGTETTIFTSGGYFNWDELDGIQIKFYLTGFRESIEHGTLTFRVYVGGSPFVPPSPLHLVETFVISDPDKFFVAGSFFTKPSGQQDIFLTIQASGFGPQPSATVKGMLFAMEVI
jgi:hypothetical protein